MTVAELLERPESWCQGSFVMNSEGRSLCFAERCSNSAAKWCLSGALATCYDGIVMMEARGKLCDVIGTANVTEWNDDSKRTHAEVLEAVRKAGI